MGDMLVKLYDLPADAGQAGEELRAQGIYIKRAMPSEKRVVLNFIEKEFSPNWADECEAGFTKGGVWLATYQKQVVGFACYNATRPDYFGPTGVRPDMRKKGLGRALLLRCMQSLREMGYAYAIIGWAGPADFYHQAVGAEPIPGEPGQSYMDLISME